jgi:hypothetical protein
MKAVGCVENIDASPVGWKGCSKTNAWLRSEKHLSGSTEGWRFDDAKLQLPGRKLRSLKTKELQRQATSKIQNRNHSAATGEITGHHFSQESPTRPGPVAVPSKPPSFINLMPQPALLFERTLPATAGGH